MNKTTYFAKDLRNLLCPYRFSFLDFVRNYYTTVLILHLISINKLNKYCEMNVKHAAVQIHGKMRWFSKKIFRYFFKCRKLFEAVLAD